MVTRVAMGGCLGAWSGVGDKGNDVEWFGGGGGGGEW